MPVLHTERIIGTVEVDGANVDVQQVLEDEIDAIREKHTSIKGRGLKKRTITDNAKVSRDIWCKMVTGWSDNVHDKNGPLKCTIENKMNVYQFDKAFAREVNIAAADLFESREEEDEKN